MLSKPIRLTVVWAADAHQASAIYNAYARVLFALGYDCKQAHALWAERFIFDVDTVDYYGL